MTVKDRKTWGENAETFSIFACAMTFFQIKVYTDLFISKKSSFFKLFIVSKIKNIYFIVIFYLIFEFKTISYMILCGKTISINKMMFFSFFLNIFFLVWLAPFGCLYYFQYFFCHQVVHLIHLVFRQTQELNPRPRTMAQTMSSRRSPLDQGASPSFYFKKKFFWRPFR